MERDRLRFGRDQFCPVLCITKAVLFVVICAVLLYLPLGDPKEECSPRCYVQKNMAFYCLCNAYKLFKETAKELTDVLDILWCLTLDALYDAKLKFYSLLRRIDEEDLCRSVCCLDDEENSWNKEKRTSSGCRCMKNCNRNNYQK